jgi:hypothetical protein
MEGGGPLKTVAAVFSTLTEAENTSQDLQRLGIPDEDISVIAGNDANRHDEYLAKAKAASVSTESAAVSSASFGGGMGIVATLIALAIPGVGPVLALGPLATVAAGMGVGAAAGGLIGTFRNMGIPHEDAPLYEEAVRRGAIMVTARVSDNTEQSAIEVMNRHGARNLRDEADTWRAAGWKGTITEEHPYPSDDSVRSS